MKRTILKKGLAFLLAGAVLAGATCVETEAASVKHTMDWVLGYTVVVTTGTDEAAETSHVAVFAYDKHNSCIQSAVGESKKSATADTKKSGTVSAMGVHYTMDAGQVYVYKKYTREKGRGYSYSYLY